VTTRVCVLDVETRVSDDARALLSASDRPTVARSALLEVTAASTLEFAISDRVTDFRMTTTQSAEAGEAAVIAAVDRALVEVGGAGSIVVTHNGSAHDLVVCARRAMHHWMLDARGVLDWWRNPPGEHVDTMLAFGDGSGRGPSLVDLAAGLGFPAAPPSRSLSRAIAPEAAKGQCDVLATAICFLYMEAARRGFAGWMADAWGELSRYLLTPAIRAPHLMPLIDIGLGLADGRPG
jgi:hypothetical protein